MTAAMTPAAQPAATAASRREAISPRNSPQLTGTRVRGQVADGQLAARRPGPASAQATKAPAQARTSQNGAVPGRADHHPARGTASSTTPEGPCPR